MQSELLTEIRTFIRGIETPRRYSAWKHGDSEVEIALHLQDGKEHHLGYVSTTQEAALVIDTVEARHGITDDSNRDNNSNAPGNGARNDRYD